MLNEELNKYSIKIIDIVRKNNKWSYVLDNSMAKFYDAIILKKEGKNVLNDPNGEFIIDVENNISKIEIISKRGNRWHPYIVFFDKDLKILKIYKDIFLKKRLKIKIQPNTKYLKITDYFANQNLDNGIIIIKKE